jgi:hypothetical protein
MAASIRVAKSVRRASAWSRLRATWNADINMAEVSAIVEHSTYEPNPDPNPAGLRPAPGPSSVQVLGSANSIEESDEPLGNKMEETR